MKFSLSTNWCNRRIASGEEIADKAMELGFTELELGYHTTIPQAKGFKARLDQIPVGSVHAFCPVPMSAPQGYPELYQLASFDEEDRKMAKVMIRRNIAFAAEMGADTVVLHAGRVAFDGFLDRIDSQKLREAFKKSDHQRDEKPFSKMFVRASRRRTKRGEKMLDLVKAELADLVPDLERHHVMLALENLPYYEGFPLPDELQTILSWNFGDHVKGWYDTGHARVCQMNGWLPSAFVLQPSGFVGMHLNDVEAFEDDHFAPGRGNVDFAALKTFAEKVRHVVFEPNAGVKTSDLRRGVEYIRKLWDV